MRRFPPPRRIEPIEGGFKVIDANKQTIAYVYGHADQRDADAAKGLTLDEARHIARLPKLLGKGKAGRRGWMARNLSRRWPVIVRSIERRLR